MVNKPLVSIIIPTYNRAHLIGETLDSVLAQTYENWECIIVDDGSTDDTEDLISNYCKQDNRFSYYHRPKDLSKGGNAARNYGFEISKGDYINWFDDDDIMLNNFIDFKVNSFKPGLNFIITTGFNVNNNLENKKKIEIFDTDDLFKEYCLWNLKIFTPSILFRRDFLIGKSLFNLNLKRGQETELFSRLFFKIESHQYKIMQEYVFLYRQHELTKSFKSSNYIKDYKESQTYIFIENLKRSLSITNNELINYYYKLLLSLFFQALENNHEKNSCFILKSISQIFFKKYKLFSIYFFFLCFFSIYIKKGRWRIEKYLKKHVFR